MDSFKDIKEDLQTILKDEVRLYSLKGIEKTSMLLGVIATFIIVLIIFVLGIVFGSLALAKVLNASLDHEYLGYLIVGGGDLLLSVLLIVWVQRTKVPLLTSLFIKILVNIFNIGSDEDK
jgi:uncharacterized membrane protein